MSSDRGPIRPRPPYQDLWLHATLTVAADTTRNGSWGAGVVQGGEANFIDLRGHLHSVTSSPGSLLPRRVCPLRRLSDERKGAPRSRGQHRRWGQHSDGDQVRESPDE